MNTNLNTLYQLISLNCFILSGILDEIGSVDYIRLQNHINMLNEQMIDQREGFAIRERDGNFRYEGEREKESGWSLDEEMEYNIYPNMYHSLRSGSNGNPLEQLSSSSFDSNMSLTVFG